VSSSEEDAPLFTGVNAKPSVAAPVLTPAQSPARAFAQDDASALRNKEASLGRLTDPAPSCTGVPITLLRSPTSPDQPTRNTDHPARIDNAERSRIARLAVRGARLLDHDRETASWSG